MTLWLTAAECIVEIGEFSQMTSLPLPTPLAEERGQNLQPVNSRGIWLIYLSAAAFLLLRTPFEVIHGMVEGEEGTTYLRYAWDTPVLRALFAPHQGYYSFFTNVCGIIAARVLPLQFAGYLFVFGELAVHMLLACMLVQCESFVGVKQKALAVAVGLLTIPTVAIVLCTTNAQFFLAVMSAVILISDAERLRTTRVLALAFAGLNGVLSCVLLPFFLLRAWSERTTGRITQAIALSACTLLQGAAVLSGPGATVGRHSTFAFFSGAFLVNGPLSQFFTRWAGQKMCHTVGSAKLLHWQSVWWLGVELAAVFCVIGLLFLLWKGKTAPRLLGSAAVLSLLLCLARGGALDYELMCGSGARYFFTFNLFIALGLVLVSLQATGKTALAARFLVVCSLVSGALDLTYLATVPHSPVWGQEVELWRADPEHRLRIGPGAWPGIKLTPQHGEQNLPANIYDSTTAGWQDR